MRTVTLLFSLLFSWSIQAAALMNINVTTDQPRFIISLPANPTTGYRWTVKSYDNKILNLVSSQFHRAKTKMMGAGGQMIFNFAINNGTTLPASTRIEFLYAQPWQPQSGTSEVVIVNFKAPINVAPQ